MIRPQHGASVGVQSSCGALKRLALKCKSEMFSYVSLINSHTQHDAFVGVQSSCGALKHLALKYKSEMFNCVLPINSHTRRFAVTVSFRRKLLTLRQLCPRAPSRPSVSPYRTGGASTSTSLKSQLVQVVIPPQHGAYEEKDPLAVLSSIHSPILGRV